MEIALYIGNSIIIIYETLLQFMYTNYEKLGWRLKKNNNMNKCLFNLLE